MSKLKVSVCKHHIASCNSCSAKGYESKISLGKSHQVDTLFDIEVGNTVLCLCEDCIKDLTNRLLDILDTCEDCKRKQMCPMYTPQGWTCDAFMRGEL